MVSTSCRLTHVLWNSLGAVMKNRKQFVILILLQLFSSLSFSLEYVPLNSKWFNPVIIGTGGAAIATKIGQPQTYSPVDLCFYRYQPKPTNSTRALWGISLGHEMPLFSFSLWALDVGVGYYQASAFTGGGTLTQGADDPSADNYKYSYKVQSKQLLVEGKLLGKIKEQIHPYLLLGIGTAFNKNYGYKTNVPSFFTYTPMFSNNTQTNFSYELGAGIDLGVYGGWRIGAGYRFSGLGKANFGAAEIDAIPIGNTLIQSNLYTNQVLIQLTYSSSVN